MQTRTALAGEVYLGKAMTMKPPTKAMPVARVNIVQRTRQSVIALLTQAPANTRFPVKINTTLK